METSLERAKYCQQDMLHMALSMSNRVLTGACNVVLHDPRFIVQVGSSGKHHAYPGGLAIHTHEVVTYALGMAAMFKDHPGMNLDVLITSAIFHDYMKVKEYIVYGNGQIQTTPYRHLVRHVAGSHSEFVKAIAGQKIDDQLVTEIEHTMLAHHGRFEFGSPVEPKLLYAYILHCADQFSAKFGPRSLTK